MDGTPLRYFARAIFLSAAVLAASACGQLSSEKATVAGQGPGAQGGGSTLPPSSGPVVNTAGFFVNAYSTTNSTMVKFLHQADAPYGSDITTSNFSSSCKVAEGSTVGQDLTCVAEVEELDLYFTPLTIQYHVPSDMCTYLRVKPYWFYANTTGTGPTVVSHHVNFGGTITDVSNTRNGQAVCQYDHTGEGGANCCLGPYTHFVQTYASDGSFQTSISPGDWGGKVGNCAAGPATTLTGFSKNPVLLTPIPTIYYIAGTGVNETYEIDPPIVATYAEHRLFTNVWAANFYKPSDHTGGLPAGLKTPSTVNGVSLNQLAPFDTYEFQCLNAAEELQHRIRLFVREWNEEGELHELGNPDTTGPEPSFPTSELNDRSDWANFGDLYPASSL